MAPFILRAASVAAFAIGILMSIESSARYKTCYDSEYRCETRYEQNCSTERRCYQVPGERQCRQERICETRTVQPDCRMVEECGTNALGQPICKNRQVCSGGGSAQECGYVERCENSGSRNECSDERVCDNRPIQDCGYVQVPRQCWEPDPVDPTPVDPTPWPVDPVDPVDPSLGLGPDSIQKLRVTIGSNATVLTFADSAQSPTYRTRYFISVYDSSGDLVLNQFVSDKVRNHKVTLNEKLSSKQRYSLVMRVQRSGGELLSEVEFTKRIEF